MAGGTNNVLSRGSTYYCGGGSAIMAGGSPNTAGDFSIQTLYKIVHQSN